MEGGEIVLGFMQKAEMLAASDSGTYTRLFGLDLQLIHDAVLLGISIFILFLLLSYLLFNPARAYLEKRKAKIENDIDTAEKNKEEAMALKLDYEGKLKEINKEADEILSEARKRANKNEAQIIAEAREEAVRIKQRAMTEIDLERKRAMDDMKKEMVQIAALMAGKVVSANIDKTIQASLVEDTLNEIGEDTWQK